MSSRLDPSERITCGCGLEFPDGPAFGRHLERPEGPCWDSASLQVNWVLRDLKGNRASYPYATDRLMTMIRGAYEYGVTVGEGRAGEARP